MFGQLHVQLSWTELAATGDAAAAPVPLTLTTGRLRAPAAATSPGKRSEATEIPKAAPVPVSAPAPAPAPAPAQKAKVMAPPPRQPSAAAVVPPPAAAADEIEEVEAYTDDDDEFEPDSPPKPPAAAVATTAAAARGAPAGARPAAIEYWEYTHRGGTGNGPKENQDTHFTIKIDEDNWLFAVLDGHGGDNGRIASQAASRAMQDYLRPNFQRLHTEPEAVMKKAFELAHTAIYDAIKRQPDTFEKDMGAEGIPGMGELLVMEHLPDPKPDPNPDPNPSPDPQPPTLTPSSSPNPTRQDARDGGGRGGLGPRVRRRRRRLDGLGRRDPRWQDARVRRGGRLVLALRSARGDARRRADDSGAHPRALAHQRGRVGGAAAQERYSRGVRPP
eukprot:scaffold624_cov68-Phaeocystis_antarctica.AAC.3